MRNAYTERLESVHGSQFVKKASKFSVSVTCSGLGIHLFFSAHSYNRKSSLRQRALRVRRQERREASKRPEYSGGGRAGRRHASANPPSGRGFNRSTDCSPTENGRPRCREGIQAFQYSVCPQENERLQL